ncbi:MAG TPA: histidine phosphatase family protein [Pyrinomonadaceae bacterium]|nr:histidine phosphatase family protein [Pyrinomonadaceae bacterium]
MKTLLLLRHAKSSWKNPELRDFDRPLNKRGLKAAPLMGEFMKERRLRPDLVISSPAVRARQTAALAVESGELQTELRYDERIYEADVPALLKVVSQIDEAAETAMIVGHNPGLQELLRFLTDEDYEFPTAALALVSLKMDKWSAVAEGSGRLKWLVTPRSLAKE